MLFSVLVPVYNAEKYIVECVNSILNQEEQNFEIILLDDCSTDNSANLCEQYEMKYPTKIRFIRHKKNEGLLMSRRELFEKSRGEWVICVDADDLLKNNALSEIKKIINQYDKVDLILYNLICIHIDNREEIFKPNLQGGFIYQNSTKQNVYLELIENYILNSICTKAIRREVLDLDKTYFEFRNLSSGEDKFQSYPILDNANEIYYLDKELYIYMKNEESITGKIKKTGYDNQKLIWEREDEYIEKWEIKNQTEFSSRNSLKRVKTLLNFIRRLYESNDMKKDFSLVIDTIQNDGILTSEYIKVKGRINFRDNIMCLIILNRKFKLLKFYLGCEKRIVYLKKGK